MTKRHRLSHLDAMMGRRRVASAKWPARRKMKAMLLGEVRKHLGFTQSAIAEAMGVSQSALSQVESQNDLQLSTLRRLVRALGGELDIIAHFGDQSIVLTDAKRKLRVEMRDNRTVNLTAGRCKNVVAQ